MNFELETNDWDSHDPFSFECEEEEENEENFETMSFINNQITISTPS